MEYYIQPYFYTHEHLNKFKLNTLLFMMCFG